MLDLIKDCCNCFLLSLVKKHLNEHIMYYNSSFLTEKSFRNLSSLFHNLIYRFWIHSYSLSRFSVSLKSLSNYFFRRFAYKSLLNRFSVLINYIMWSSNHFSISSCFPRFSASKIFRVQVFQDVIVLINFQGLGFSGSRFFRLQAQSPDPELGSRF